MSRQRNGNVVIEPPPVHALTAEEARAHMQQLAICVSEEKFASTLSVTAHCWRNELMTREYVDELYRLVTGEYGVPRLRVIDPTPDAASYLFEAARAAGKPDSIEVRISDNIGRTSHKRFATLGEYLNAAA